MKLLEVFDSPYNFSAVDYRGPEVYYNFTTDSGVDYKVGFREKKISNEHIATVAFALADNKINLFNAKGKDRELGNSFRVLGTVVAAMRDFLNQHPGITAFHFSIDKSVDVKGSLEGVYNKMIDRLLPPGWNVQFIDTGIKDSANYIITLPGVKNSPLRIRQ